MKKSWKVRKKYFLSCIDRSNYATGTSSLRSLSTWGSKKEKKRISSRFFVARLVLFSFINACLSFSVNNSLLHASLPVMLSGYSIWLYTLSLSLALSLSRSLSLALFSWVRVKKRSDVRFLKYAYSFCFFRFADLGEENFAALPSGRVVANREKNLCFVNAPSFHFFRSPHSVCLAILSRVVSTCHV